MELKDLLERFRSLEPEAQAERDELMPMIQALAVELDLCEANEAWGDDAEAQIARLTDAVLELEYTLIPCGLHVVGQAPSDCERVELLLACAEATHGEAGGEQPLRLAVEAMVRGAMPEAALAALQAHPALATDEAQAHALATLRELARTDALLCEDHEMDGILRALDGRFLRPAPGGDLLRTPAILPTGRNVHGFDPFRIPSAYAVKDGARQAERLIARHMADGNAFPDIDRHGALGHRQPQERGRDPLVRRWR
jgi:magnesium chelatase subunit H